MAAHRYWRLLFRSAYQTSWGFQLAEIQFRETIGTPQSFSGGTASASSVYSTFTADKAADGNGATYWSAVQNPALPISWNYDYGASVTKDIKEVYLMCAAAANTHTVQDFDLQWSDDGTNWTSTLACVAADWTTSNQVQLFSAPTTAANGNHRGWRLRIYRANGIDYDYFQMAEVQFREAAGVSQLFSGGSAAASSVLSSTYSADKACDNNATTYWTSIQHPVNPAWWSYDYGGSPKRISQISIQAAGSGSNVDAPTTFNMECSDDMRNWQTAGIYTSPANWSGGEVRTFDLAWAAYPTAAAPSLCVVT